MATKKAATTTTKTATKKSASSNAKVGLGAPWVRYGKLIINLFTKDPSIKVITDRKEDGGVYNIYIKSNECTKLAAIKKIIGEEVELGNVTIAINYEDTSKHATIEDYAEAFKDTGYLVACESMETPMGNFDCPIFAKEIIQFFNDDTIDMYGNENIVVADAVREVTKDKDYGILITTANGTEED